VRLLLDTHVLIWLGSAPDLVPTNVRQAVAVSDETFVSVVSAWEYGVKRLKFPNEFCEPFEILVAGLGHVPLDLPFECHRYSESLPPIHRDPFDRMLIAQALHLDLTLVSADETIRRYPVPTLW